jgi:hypothetical protein
LEGGARQGGGFWRSAFSQSVLATARKHKKRSYQHQKFLHNPIVLSSLQRYYKKSLSPTCQNQSKSIKISLLSGQNPLIRYLCPAVVKKGMKRRTKNNIKIMICCAAHDDDRQ